MPESGSEGSPASTLKLHGLRPRKRLGQHFLRDRTFLEKIVAAAGVEPGDRVVEIGPGTGVLTGALLERGATVLAVELDDALVDLLREEYAAVPHLEIWHGNALSFDPCAHVREPYKLAGNIPYYITGPILRHFLESDCPPTLLVLMVQREVAERMAARPGDLSLLGVSVQFYADPTIVTRVPRGAFHPPPKVESAVVRLVPHPPPVPVELRGDFFAVARAGFGTRRKTLTNALSIGLGIPKGAAGAILSAAQIDGRMRAEALSLEDWARLATAYAAFLRGDGR